jgi:hypothetical protein
MTLNLTVGELYVVDLIHNRDLYTVLGVCEAIGDNSAIFRPLANSLTKPIAVEVPYSQIIYTEPA